jgi:hypothetical protein
MGRSQPLALRRTGRHQRPGDPPGLRQPLEGDGVLGFARLLRPPRRRRTRRVPVMAPARARRAHIGVRAAPGEQGEPRPRPRRSHDPGLGQSGGEALAAALAPTLQHRPSTARAHAQPEPVGLLPLAIVGLKCALHAWPPRGPRLFIALARSKGRATTSRRSLRARATHRQRGGVVVASRSRAHGTRATRSASTPRETA